MIPSAVLAAALAFSNVNASPITIPTTEVATTSTTSSALVVPTSILDWGRRNQVFLEDYEEVDEDEDENEEENVELDIIDVNEADNAAETGVLVGRSAEPKKPKGGKKSKAEKKAEAAKKAEDKKKAKDEKKAKAEQKAMDKKKLKEEKKIKQSSEDKEYSKAWINQLKVDKEAAKKEAEKLKVCPEGYTWKDKICFKPKCSHPTCRNIFPWEKNPKVLPSEMKYHDRITPKKKFWEEWDWTWPE